MDFVKIGGTYIKKERVIHLSTGQTTCENKTRPVSVFITTNDGEFNLCVSKHEWDRFFQELTKISSSNLY
jgi:hypothetical protein